MSICVGKVDNKGRMVLPVNIRKMLNIEPFDYVEYEIKEVKRARFVDKWEGAVKCKANDPVKLIHESFLRK